MKDSAFVPQRWPYSVQKCVGMFSLHEIFQTHPCRHRSTKQYYDYYHPKIRIKSAIICIPSLQLACSFFLFNFLGFLSFVDLYLFFFLSSLSIGLGSLDSFSCHLVFIFQASCKCWLGSYQVVWPNNQALGLRRLN